MQKEEKPKSITLIGPRSIGKSSVGKILAKKLKHPFYDLDDLFEKKIGLINDFIKKDKYDEIRRKESKLLSTFLKYQKKSFILAVGGGTIASQLKQLSIRNLKNLKKFSKIVYLIPSKYKKVNLEILEQREKARKGDQSRNQIKKLYDLRVPIFEKAADYIIFTRDLKPLQIVNKIVVKLK